MTPRLTTLLTRNIPTCRLPTSLPFGRSIHTSRRCFKGSASSPQVEGATDVSHASFISTASSKSNFNPLQTPTAGQEINSSTTLQLDINKWQGKLSPTSSHLFKLLIPLPKSSSSPSSSSKTNTNTNSNTNGKVEPIQTAFLLHPSQPLSHLSRLITGSLPRSYNDSEITYLAVTGEAKDIDTHLRNAEEENENPEQVVQEHQGKKQQEQQEGGPFLEERKANKGRWQEVSWSQSTDLSDFIKQSCLNERFKIVISPFNEPNESSISSGSSSGDNSDANVTKKISSDKQELTIEVMIPSFASRTHYIRRRLMTLTKELDRMTKQKKKIDLKAHKGAQRLAVVALSGGVVYWGTVIRYTFFTDAGWDLMEPVTWATGFAALLSSAAFLIYHNREVSYSSLLDLSISARQRKLYDQAGLDIERWTEMVAEAKTLRKEISRIASDYDIEWRGELDNLAEEASKSIQSRRDEVDHPSSTVSASASPSTVSSRSVTNKEKEEEEGSHKDKKEEEKDDQEEQEEKEEKLDIDKTISEASELAEQSENSKSKQHSAARKSNDNDDDDHHKGNGDRGSKARKGEEKESDSEARGRKKAKELIDT
ncbi:uncharacterized protein IL334_003071 [Kwoniella shivajii]|uniref:Calcium uniporter protein, mitochondrial n=1 Tax=Kwoniella shivajii TaxID=564305 RepID=A0ABZ1CX35_9TREE|nr:hypothetical protein IL334_003071 [Kwoniella shivajii]